MKKGERDYAYFSKCPEYDALRMMGGLEESILNWKEYFWKVSIDPKETQLDFNSTWVKSIHKGELDLGPNDKVTVKKILEFVLE